TRYNNSAADKTLQFTVAGVISGATVQVFADGTLIGETTATGTTATVTTDGTTLINDGQRAITATQDVGGSVSSASPSLTITIDSVGPAGIMSTPVDTVAYDQAYSFDADSPDEGQVTYSLANAPSGMTINSSTGALSWTPTLAQAIPHTFDIEVSDDAGNVTATTVNVTVLGVVDALPDTYPAFEETTLTVTADQGVLANDGSQAAGTLTATLVSDASHGTVTLNADGSFSYVPAANFSGTDTFTYKANDGSNDTNVALVTIEVANSNDPPTTAEDSYTTAEDTTLTVDAANGLLANDSDIDGDTLTASLANQPSHGTVTINADGSFTYVPDTNYNGSDSFAYRVSDGTVVSDPVSVQVTVTAVDDLPLAVSDTYTVNEDAVLTVAADGGVLANDTDPDGTLTVSVTASPSNGTLSLSADGSFTYTPNANFAGTDSFTYRATDGTNNSSATVTITVVNQPDPPVANADTFTVPANSSDFALSVLNNDVTTPDLFDTLTIASVTQGSQGGSLTIGTDGQLLYTPAADFMGSETFSYTVEDSDGLTSTASVTLNVADVSENSISGTVYIDANNNGTLDTGEIGVPGVQLTVTGTATTGESISRSVITNNQGAYTFEALPAGTYTLSETQPTALADGQDSTGVTNATVGDDQITNIVLSGSQNVSGNNFGESRLLAAYTSIAWFFASSTDTGAIFRESVAMSEYKAGRTELAQAIRSGGTVTPPPSETNRLPVAVNDQYSVGEATTLTVSAADGVLKNDTDADGDTLTAALVNTTTHGALVLNTNGSFTYTPDVNFTGTDTFTYTASDGVGLSGNATVTITVNDDPNTFSVAENSATGTLVGRISSGAASGTLAFELADSTRDTDLSLRPDDHYSGDTTAPVVLIEYLDLQCPICQTFHPIVKQLEDDFDGELLVVRRHFPLIDPHPLARQAAIAAEAAGRQGKFDEMADMMYTNQDSWTGLSDASSVFRGYAEQLSLNLTQYDADLLDPTADARVTRDFDAAVRLEASGAPTFFLNGVKLENADAQADFAGLI
ncbi:MAG: tandem-95 repeat protein, partial [Planctomycetales bacterium]|nr:tandem-95 repeat protein [Planctomycetales bacterium]